MHERSMTQENNVRPEKPRNPPKPPKPAKTAAEADGTLDKKSVARLELTLKHMAGALGTMEKQLLCAANSTCIAPQLVAKLTALKSQVEAEQAAIELYKENNQESGTYMICDQAKTMLDSALKQFHVLKKMVRVEGGSKKPKAEVIEPGVAEA